jgi:hypothetical protein
MQRQYCRMSLAAGPDSEWMAIVHSVPGEGKACEGIAQRWSRQIKEDCAHYTLAIDRVSDVSG